MNRTTLLLLALLVLGGPAVGETVYLTGGSTLEGEILEFDDQNIVLTLDQLPGSRITIPMTRISRFGQFELRRARLDPGSAEAHEKLGDWAEAQGMFALSMDEYRAAIRILGEAAPDPLREKFRNVSNRCGMDKLARGKALVREGQLVHARRFFRDIVKNHATCPAVEEARRRAAEIGKRIEDERRAAREAAGARSDLEKFDAGLAAVRELLVRGQRQKQLGLEDSGRLARAENAFEAAVESLRRARDRLEALKKSPAAGRRSAETRLLDAELNRSLIDTYVALGHNHVVKGNLIKANRCMGLALALDPNDPSALALRQAIAIATGSDRWGRGR